MSKSENVKPLQQLLKDLDVAKMRIIEMSQGQKSTRVLAWRFNTDEAWLLLKRTFSVSRETKTALAIKAVFLIHLDDYIDWIEDMP